MATVMTKTKLAIAAKADRYAERLLQNADDIYSRRVSLNEFRRRNREIHDAIKADGESMNEAVMRRVFHPGES